MSSSRFNKTNSMGVALLEVLLAMTVVGIGMGVSFKTFSLATRLESKLEKQAIARRLAERQTAILRLQNPSGQSNGEVGKFDSPFEEYQWTAEWSSPQGEFPFQLLRVRVLMETDEPALYRLETLLNIK